MVNDKYKDVYPNGIKPDYWVLSEVYEKRLDSCNSCLNLDKETRDCKSCGCPMDSKAWLDWFGCPINKWKAEKELQA